MKTFVYGDSFSNHEWCQCPQDRMWYAEFIQGELIDRTRVSASTQEMFLLATTDAVANPTARFILGTGVMYSRMMLYTDQLYADEQRHDSIDSCLQHFDTQQLDRELHVGIYHHTLVWSQYLANVVSFGSVAQQWLITHMNTPANEHIAVTHPLIQPLLKRTMSMPEYIDHRHSCRHLCEQAGILPHDHAQYGWDGHHSEAGQHYFGQHIQAIIKEREIWT